MRLTDTAFAEAIGELARSVGRRDFEELVLNFLGTLVHHDFTTMTRYSRFSIPEYLVHSKNFSKDIAHRYLTDYYRVDPFYKYWRTYEKPGIVWLGDVSSSGGKRSRYFREFLSDYGISDEVGIFLPPVGRASVALFLERARGRYGKRDRLRLQRVYPIVAGLHGAHVSTLFGGSDEDASRSLALPAARPTLVTDRSGHRVYVNTAWRHLEAEESTEIATAFSKIAGKTEQQVLLTGDRVMHRQELESRFRLAPGGHLWTIESVGKLSDAGRVPSTALFDEALTPREQDIVGLILDGYPTDLIAKKLGLSRGTVKNHRRRIYHKLDITTERELFRQYIDRILRRPASGKG